MSLRQDRLLMNVGPMAGRPTAAAVLILMLLACQPGTGLRASDGGWTIPPFRLGDVAVYDVVGPSSVTSTTFELRDDAVSRDGFGRQRVTTVVDVRFATPGPSDLRYGVDQQWGVSLWSEYQQHGDDEIQRFFDFGAPFFWGASVLGGRTLFAGDVIELPLWDASTSHVATLTAGPQFSEGGEARLPVRVDLPAGLRDLPWAYSLIDSSTLVFEPWSAYPLRVVPDAGAHSATRHSVTGGSGVQVWGSQGSPEPAWARSPHLRFEPRPSPYSPPPEDLPGAPYWKWQLAEAIQFAEANAPGLQAFMEQNDPLSFTWGSTQRRSGLTIDAAGVDLVRQTDPSWFLRWAVPGTTQAWYVEVGADQTVVAGLRVVHEPRILREGATTERAADSLGMAGDLVELSSWGASLPSWTMSTALDGFLINRDAAGLWTIQDAFHYSAKYLDGGILGPNAGWVHFFNMDARTGYLDYLNAPEDVVAEYDATGWGPWH